VKIKIKLGDKIGDKIPTIPSVRVSSLPISTHSVSVRFPPSPWLLCVRSVIL